MSAETQETYYTILNCANSASAIEIKQSYQELVKKFHPDKQQTSNQDAFIRIDKAYKVLRDDKLRKEYDASLLQAQLNQEALIYAELSKEDIKFDESTKLAYYPCRCGHCFEIEEDYLMEESCMLECSQCSNYLALYLLGKVLVRELDNKTIIKGRIVETECYLGGEDKASQSYNGKRTPRNEPMYMPAGTCYVYMTYGMYFCFNISSTEPGAAVLLRALHPLAGQEEMLKFRSKKLKSAKRILKDIEFCNGPSKLCIALDINKETTNKMDICNSGSLWLEDDPSFDINSCKIVNSSRIGIDSVGEEWAKKLLRFYILGCPHVSKRDRKAEEIAQDISLYN